MRSVIAWLVLAAPIASGTALMAYVSAAERTHGTTFMAVRGLNSAEAAALGDGATALRLVRFGEDPNRAYPIRAWIIGSSVQRATTMEAAMWSRRIEMVRALDRQGVIVGAEARRGLACLARDLDLPEIVAYLAPDAACVPGKALQAVLARTQPAGTTAHE